MSVSVIKKEFICEADGFRQERVYTSDGGVSICRTPILSDEEYSRREQSAIEVLSRIECARMAREAKKIACAM